MIIFEEGDLTVRQRSQLVEAGGSRPVDFQLVDFDEFPSGFDSHEEEVRGGAWMGEFTYLTPSPPNFACCLSTARGTGRRGASGDTSK